MRRIEVSGLSEDERIHKQVLDLNLVAQKKLGQDGSKADNWQVVVTQHVVTHNHSLDAKTYMSYPQNRRVDDPEVLETVNTLRKAGVKQSKIRSYLTEKAPNKPMTKSDVHNLLTKLKDDANFTAKLNATAQWSTVSTTVPTAGGQDATTLNYTTALPTTTQAQLNALK
ncbi:hypothetical protein JM18_008246 [Phytophthora kernoviae]|uniref:Uncharacterized protein n=1 Tax=Phytophthora kernoviae TaxID=325452 RepID=A0A921SAI6_9STRA|nr:hypothetical protein JM18_008246 [Phytophthora kernoviae]